MEGNAVDGSPDGCAPVRDLLNGDGPPQPMPYVIRVLRPRPDRLFPTTSSRTRTAYRLRQVPDTGVAEACRIRSAPLNLVHRAYPGQS